MQYFRLTLKCGGVYETSAVGECANCGRAFEHNYVGKEMPARCCDGDHTVVKQEAISKLMGLQGNEPHPKE